MIAGCSEARLHNLLRCPESHAGDEQVLECRVLVAEVDVDGTDRIGGNHRLEPRGDSVEGGRPHTVVGGETSDDDAGDTAFPQQVGEAGSIESRVRVDRGIVTLADDDVGDACESTINWSIP